MPVLLGSPPPMASMPGAIEIHRKLDTLGEYAEKVMSFIMPSVIDDKWKDHLYDLDHLKASIGFRGWDQKDPLVEYKKEAYDMFVGLMADLRKTVGTFFFRAQLGQQQPQRRQPQRLQFSGPTETAAGGAVQAAAEEQGRQAPGGRDLGRLRHGQPRRGPERPGVFRGWGGRLAGMGSSGQDPKRLATNRGQEERTHEPITVEDAPGRNDPCPCGSGKK